VKPIFIDLDGTLLCDKKQISQRARDAFQHARNVGYEPIICTGRDHWRAREYAEQVGCRYMIYLNGTCIYDLHDEKVLTESPIHQTVAMELYKQIADPACNVIFINGKTRHILKNVDFTCSILQHEKDIFVSEVNEEFFAETRCTLIIVVSTSIAKLEEIKSRVLNTVPGVSVVNQGYSRELALNKQVIDKKPFVDFARAGINKGSAVQHFCKIFNIPQTDTIAIGDDINDIEMFQTAGLAVAMGNSIPEILDLADIVVEDNNSEGVAKFMENLV
jgi:hypothetical protein